MPCFGVDNDITMVAFVSTLADKFSFETCSIEQSTFQYLTVLSQCLNAWCEALKFV